MSNPTSEAITEMTSTASTANTLVINDVKWEHMSDPNVTPTPRWTEGLIKCRIGHANEIQLVPLTDLGASVLAALMHGEHQFAATMTGRWGPGHPATYGRELSALTITQKTRPMLSSGDDPYFTGMTLTADEVKACRAFVDARRAEEAPRRRSKKRRAR